MVGEGRKGGVGERGGGGECKEGKEKSTFGIFVIMEVDARKQVHACFCHERHFQDVGWDGHLVVTMVILVLLWGF